MLLKGIVFFLFLSHLLLITLHDIILYVYRNHISAMIACEGSNLQQFFSPFFSFLLKESIDRPFYQLHLITFPSE